jgi:hypothetical protein
MPGSGSERTFYLELKVSSQRGVEVAEQSNRRQFPPFCLERHINPDHTFCLYLGSELPFMNDQSVLEWWSGLGSFLVNQVYAERRAVWPLAAGLSHGEAAGEQLEMEALAEPLGWKDEILQALFRGKGWLAGRLPRASKKDGRIVNVRSPCPRGCTYKHKLWRRRACDFEDCAPDCRRQHSPILRTDCPHRVVIEGLVLHEHKRRKIECEIIKELANKGQKCCGTMKNCALRQHE